MGCQTNEGGKEGRREEFERGFNPAQFLATKSEIMMGDLGPCSLAVARTSGQRVETLPSAFLVKKKM
ncbi:hypothetical protein [Nostoc sp. UIC 10630]|uniref:hypothetical protein n=1 Tax=Nostoc sp. UIC 10630 TaxID=2100146 RepID=UPI0013D05297|nr:hypothetical protein [Nostoc sp. UIC 10630]